jgi:3-hydroxyacyl-CoA dehydrogenase
LKRMVDAGQLGRKTGHGFFDYRTQVAEPEL